LDLVVGEGVGGSGHDEGERDRRGLLAERGVGWKGGRSSWEQGQKWRNEIACRL
jgi:hypothetical protein